MPDAPAPPFDRTGMTSTDSSDYTPASPSIRNLVAEEEFRRWQQPGPIRACLDLALIWVQIGVGFTIFIWSPGIWTFVIAWLLIGGAQHGLGMAAHEFAHYLIFPRNRRLNDLVGTWLFAAPIVIPLRVFRHRHFQHHRTYSTADDPKILYKRDLRGWRLIYEAAYALSGLAFLRRMLDAMQRDRRDAKAGRKRPEPAAELPAIAITQLVIFGTCCLYHPLLYFGLWLYPYVSVGELCQKVRATMEHHPGREESNADPAGPFYKATAGPFVRTVTASWWERLFFSKINFCYHVEHHLWPQISYQHLPQLRARLLAHDSFADERYALDATYTSTIVRLWREPAEGAR